MTNIVERPYALRMGSTLYAIAPLPPSSHAYPVESFTEADVLERELRHVVTGEVRFDRGTAPSMQRTLRIIATSR